MKHWHRLFYLPAWSIAAKLLAALLCVALVPMSFTAYYNVQRSLESAEVSEYRKLELLATADASRLDQLLIDIQQVLVQVSTERDVVSFLTSTMPQRRGAFHLSVQQTLDNVFRSHPNYDAVYLLGTEGQCVAATDPTFVGQKYAFREYFRSSIQGRLYVSSILVGGTTGRPGIFFSNPVRSDSGKIVGVAILKIRVEDIWAIVDAHRVDSQSYAFLVDQQGVIISHPNKSIIYHSLATLPPETLKQIVSDRGYGRDQIKSLDIPELAAAMVGAKDLGHTSYYSRLEQKQQIVGFAPLEMEPWVLGVNKPKALFAAPLNRLIWEHSRGVLVLGGITAIITLLLARSISKPIRALTAAGQALEQGDFDPQELAEISRSQDDMGQLVRVFLQMAEQVKAREQQLNQQLKQQLIDLRIEIDETKRACHVAEITETDHFQQLQKKVQNLKEQARISDETETEYFQRLQNKVQKLKEQAATASE